MNFTSNSSNVAEVSYDPTTVELTVTFRTGKSYVYSEVDGMVYEALEAAEYNGGSCGSAFSALVRNGGYDFRLLEDS